jgi:hypothetical protein
MAKGKVLRRLALIASAIAGAMFFWRKRHAHEAGAQQCVAEAFSELAQTI